MCYVVGGVLVGSVARGYRQLETGAILWKELDKNIRHNFLRIKSCSTSESRDYKPSYLVFWNLIGQLLPHG